MSKKKVIKEVCFKPTHNFADLNDVTQVPNVVFRL